MEVEKCKSCGGQLTIKLKNKTTPIAAVCYKCEGLLLITPEPGSLEKAYIHCLKELIEEEISKEWANRKVRDSGEEE